jgi:hypothetical protein
MSPIFKVVWLKWDNEPDLELLNEAEYQALRYLPGNPLPSNAPRIRFKTRDKLADFMSFGLAVIVSEMVRMVIDRFGGAGEFYPVEIDAAEGIKTCFILNVLRKCDCLDYPASGAVVKYGIIFGFERLCLLEHRIDDVPIFLLPKNGQHVIFLRDDVANELVRCDCSGVLFIPPEGCSMGL